MDSHIDVVAAASDLRTADRIVGDDGTMRVVVSLAELYGRIWIRTGAGTELRFYPDEPVVLRCPTVRGGGYAYYAEGQPDGTVTVYRHAGKGRFAAVLASYPATTEA